MAAEDKKISGLPDADLPLNDADLMEVVQGGVNKKAPKSSVGGAGAVASVNGQTGVVVLDAGDIPFTPAGNISATDTQSAIAELDSETVSGRTAAATTGVAIAFVVPQTYGSAASPETGNVTLNSTGLVPGMVQLLIHNHATTEPTWPAQFERQGGVYVPAAINKIWMHADDATHISYWITQTI